MVTSLKFSDREGSLLLVEGFDIEWLSRTTARCCERAHFPVVKPLVRESVTIGIRRACGAEINHVASLGLELG